MLEGGAAVLQLSFRPAHGSSFWGQSFVSCRLPACWVAVGGVLQLCVAATASARLASSAVAPVIWLREVEIVDVCETA